MAKDYKQKRKDQETTEQSRRFIETARELGCDEDEAAFDEKLRRIAKAKPKPEKKEAPDK